MPCSRYDDKITAQLQHQSLVYIRPCSASVQAAKAPASEALGATGGIPKAPVRKGYEKPSCPQFQEYEQRPLESTVVVT